MIPRRLFSKIFASHVIVMLTLFLAVGFYVDNSFRRVYLTQLRTDLVEIATYVGERTTPEEFARAKSSGALLDRFPTGSPSSRLSLIRPDGTIVAESHKDRDDLDNRLERPEVQAALRGEIADTIRFSRALNQELLYVAVPIRSGDTVVGVVGASRSLALIEAELGKMRRTLIFGGLAIALFAATVSYLLSKIISAPLEQMKLAAKQFTEGENPSRLPVPHTEELGALVRALNSVGTRVTEKIREITRRKNELSAVLSSMAEGVIAIDVDEKIISMNFAAEKMFDVRFADLRGKPFQAGIRSSDFEKLVNDVRSSGTTARKDIIVYGEGDRLIEAHGTMLRGSQDDSIGVLIVMNDVTQLRRLEKVRRDFVANVSHELKTPVTSIRGFIETLLDGAAEKPTERTQFLTIIRRQADRLQKIIDDLLSLSQIEQQGEQGGLQLELGKLYDVIESARRVCDARAAEKEITLENTTPQDLAGYINPSLLEQAIVNLIDNAIKYSGRGTKVRIVSASIGDEVAITVHDQGPGIPRGQLERVFERFYRVDEGRSRKEGGTGLGLAIVKHIAHVHGGRAGVESILGQGSSFSLYIKS